jgi:hypothetical protein
MGRIKISGSVPILGISEFDEGMSSEREQIHRFLLTLKRLAKT